MTLPFTLYPLYITLYPLIFNLKNMLSLLLTIFTFVEFNCENLFDTRHDSLKNDMEYCAGGAYHWDSKRYWRKLNNIGKEIVSTGGEWQNWQVPDLVALVEVENDSVLFDLTQRSLLRTVGYKYFVTNSPDQRGIDVALLYHPYSFAPDTSYSLRITPPEGFGPTRDVLYVRGRMLGTSYPDSIAPDAKSKSDELHIFVVHAPSRRKGEKASEPYRLEVASRLCSSIDSIRAISPDANIFITGDFNDYSDNRSLLMLAEHSMVEVSKDAKGTNGALGTYRYKGEWGSLDHIFFSQSFLNNSKIDYCRIHDLPFLTEEEPKFGGVRPARTYRGYKYNYNGFSDHLPLVLRFEY
jgi:hypothetical protein